ncbi:MAG: AAA family ATPase [Clostridia bacterium]|nr:AAA family ATPase [Clostridia bacterium]
MKQLNWIFSPSRIESYFAHGDCLRALVTSGVRPEDRAVFGFGEPAKKPAVASAGDRWEDEVRSLLEKRFPVYCGKSGKMTAEEFSAFLDTCAESGADRVYFYQARLAVTPRFCEKYLSVDGLGALLSGKDERVCLDLSRPSFPDLIRADRDAETGNYRLSVVDVKLAKRPKVEHKIQVCMYIRMLEDYLEEYGRTDRFSVDRETGYLFHYGQDEETGFDTKEPMRFLDRFLLTAIPEAVCCARARQSDGALAAMLPYRIGQKCEWCDNYETCVAHCEKNGEQIMLLPYLTKYAQTYLIGLKDGGRLPSFDLDEIDRFCADGEGGELMRQSSFWKRFLPEKDLYFSALRDPSAGPQKRNLASYELPESENFRILLSAQKDEGYDRCYAFSLFAEKYRAERGQKDYAMPPLDGLKSRDGILVTKSADETRLLFSVVVTDMARQKEGASLFAEGLFAVLDSVARHNRAHPKTRITLQSYVMDNYERDNIENTLYDLLEDEDEDLRETVMKLLFCFQGRRLVEEENGKNPKDTVEDPILVLSSVVGRLFVLPAYIAYSLPGICRTFFDAGNPEERALLDALDDPSFRNRISNVIRNDRINAYWSDPAGNPSAPEEVARHLGARLKAESLLLDKLRSQGHPGIRREAAKFGFPEGDGIRRKEFGQLLFETKYEQLLDFRDSRAVLCMDAEQAAADGRILSLALTECRDEGINEPGGASVCVFEVLNADAMTKEDYFSPTVCRDTEENRRLLPFYDGGRRDGFFTGSTGEFYKKDGKTFCDFRSENYTNQYGRTVLNAVDERGYEGSLYLLFETVKDYNLKKNVSAITEADQKGMDFLVEPQRLAGPLGRALPEALLRRAGFDGFDFSPSQKVAFRHFYETGVTLLLGPPGSGKTDFIARSLLLLCLEAKEEGRTLKVLLSANSHAAIENALFKTAEKLRAAIGAGLFAENEISLCKLEKLEDGGEAVVCLETEKLAETMAEKPFFFLGSTVWSIEKARQRALISEPFDVIVIDEASQMRMADAILPMMHGREQSTRYLIVGDEEQLPAILKGRYAKDPEKPFLLGSLFRYYHDCDTLQNAAGRRFTRALSENFRMNDIISRYSAQRIYRPLYGADYKAFNERIASQTMEGRFSLSAAEEKLRGLSLTPEERNLLLRILDPAYPLVLCVPKGDTPARVRETEVLWVARITKCLEAVLAETGGEGYGAAAFWGTPKENGDFGIISPHHEHIARLKQAILAEPAPFDETREDLFIGTVDKLQGQERRAIVVSYGVTDPEQAIGEGEFVYSRNRLNVAITRAKQKCIVFLSDAVLDYPIEALGYDDPDLLDGVDYICGFRDFMKTNEDDSETDKTGIDGTLTVYRKRLKPDGEKR